MEIRMTINMNESDPANASRKTKPSDEEFPRPISPCDSEISVGCENDERSEPTASSPMDMTEALTEDEEGEEPNAPRSPSTSRGQQSPQTLSPVSVHDESDSFTYLSEDEYFRPLKRLAMSDALTPPPGAESMSSPEPSSVQSPEAKLTLPQSLQGKPSLPKPQPSNDERLRENGGETNNPSQNGAPGEEEMDDRRDLERDREAEQKLSGLRSFSILDILSYKPSRRKSSIPVKIVRPWDTRKDSTPDVTPTRPSSQHESTNNNNSHSNNNNNTSSNNNNNKRQGGQNDRGSALDALFKMTNKTLDNLNKEDKADAVNLFNNRQPTKKKRKSRTAFTNHQIFELEKRFLYQKYLSPADRDELAQSLGLSNAQVITWFQNRRAKLKRDMEELKRDVESSKVIHNKTLLEASANVVAFLKAKELPKIHLASLPR